MGDLYLRIGFGLVGATAVAWNAVWFWRMRLLLLASERVEGTVTRLNVPIRPESPHIMFRYVVTYRVGEQEFEAPVPGKGYVVGQSVPVRYLPENPAVALVGWLVVRLFGPLFMTTWGGTLIFMAFRS